MEMYKVLSMSVFLLFSLFELEGMDAALFTGHVSNKWSQSPRSYKKATTKKKKKVAFPKKNEFPEEKIKSFIATIEESKRWNEPFEFYFIDLLKKIVACDFRAGHSENMYKLFIVVNTMRKNQKSSEIDGLVLPLLQKVTTEKTRLDHNNKDLEEKKRNLMLEIKAVEKEQAKLKVFRRKDTQKIKILQSLMSSKDK